MSDIFTRSEPCTDENVAYLKDWVEVGGEIPSYMICPLIARLEAAEDCIDDHRADCLADVGRKCTCGYADKLAKWCKITGKL